MAKKPTLKAQKREGTGKGVARRLRQDGRVPAVLYGRELDSVHLSVDAREAEHLFHAISVDNTIVSLKVEGTKEPYETLVREIQTHPWKASMLHIDFLRIQKGVAVDLDVPVRRSHRQDAGQLSVGGKSCALPRPDRSGPAQGHALHRTLA